jgi:hypothetical protein
MVRDCVFSLVFVSLDGTIVILGYVPFIDFNLTEESFLRFNATT